MADDLRFSECTHTMWQETKLPGKVACIDGCGAVRVLVPEMSLDQAKAIVEEAMRRVFDAGFSVYGFDDGSVQLTRTDNIGNLVSNDQLEGKYHL